MKNLILKSVAAAAILMVASCSSPKTYKNEFAEDMKW